MCAALLEAGYLEEIEIPEVRVGRPPKKLRLAREKSQILGVVIAPGMCWVVASGLDGELSEGRTRKIRTPDSYDALIDGLVGQAQALMAGPGPETLGAGVCIPGLVEEQRGVSVLAANLPIIEGRSPATDLAERLGIECVPLQAKHALCLAERHIGEIHGIEDSVVLDFSTGVGMGMVSRGRLLQGADGFAGEVGHITIEPEGRPCSCGSRGCLQTVASDPSVAARVARRLRRPIDIDEVVVLSQAEQLDLSEEVEEVVRYLSIGIATVINILNPSAVFLHGQLFDLEANLFPRLLEGIRRRTLRPLFDGCRIVRARGDKRQGAVVAILDHLIDSFTPRR
jgi:N-acetylglucosamine repressor